MDSTIATPDDTPPEGDSSEPEGRKGVGDRVRSARALAGLKRWELAREAHVSESLIKQVENGDKAASPWFVAHVARGLRMSVRELYGEYVPSYGTERASVAELETAVMAGNAIATDDRPTVSVADLRQRVVEALEGRRRADFDRVATSMPRLLADAHRLASTTRSDDGLVWNLIAQAYGHASLVLHHLGSDIASYAAEKGVHAAEQAGDPVLAAVLHVEGCLTLMQRGAWTSVESITERARVLAEDSLDDARSKSARGFAHLRSAIVTARSGNVDRSNEHLDHARELAMLIPPNASYDGTSFNLDNATMHGVGAMVEASEGAAALRRKAPIDERASPPARIGAYHFDLSRAHLLVGDYDRSLAELQAAREIAPQLTRYHPQFAETLRVLAHQLARRRGSVPELARWGGVRV